MSDPMEVTLGEDVPGCAVIFELGQEPFVVVYGDGAVSDNVAGRVADALSPPWLDVLNRAWDLSANDGNALPAH